MARLRSSAFRNLGSRRATARQARVWRFREWRAQSKFGANSLRVNSSYPPQTGIRSIPRVFKKSRIPRIQRKIWPVFSCDYKLPTKTGGGVPNFRHDPESRAFGIGIRPLQADSFLALKSLRRNSCAISPHNPFGRNSYVKLPRRGGIGKGNGPGSSRRSPSRLPAVAADEGGHIPDRSDRADP